MVGYDGGSVGFPNGLNPCSMITTFPQASLRSRTVGFPEERGGSAPDGGVDLGLRTEGKATVVQCNHWREAQVSVQPVREIFVVMHAAGADAVVFVYSCAYTSNAVEFARDQPIRLIDGEELAGMVPAIQEERLVESRDAKGIAPSRSPPKLAQSRRACANSMVQRIAKTGHRAGQPFWGCSRYPTFKGKSAM